MAIWHEVSVSLKNMSIFSVSQDTKDKKNICLLTNFTAPKWENRNKIQLISIWKFKHENTILSGALHVSMCT